MMKLMIVSLITLERGTYGMVMGPSKKRATATATITLAGELFFLFKSSPIVTQRCSSNETNFYEK